MAFVKVSLMVDVKGPIRAYLYPHKAILVELESLEKKSMSLHMEGGGDLEEFKRRLEFLKMFFDAHEAGEEAALYPAADSVRKDIAKPFEWDKHVAEEYFRMIFDAIGEFGKSRERSASLRIVMGMSALRASLGPHESKEDEVLLPLIDSGLDARAQGEVVGKAMSKFDPSAVENVEKFLIKRLSQNERVEFLKVVKLGASPEIFNAIIGWVKEVLSEDEWKELKAKMPELA